MASQLESHCLIFLVPNTKDHNFHFPRALPESMLMDKIYTLLMANYCIPRDFIHIVTFDPSKKGFQPTLIHLFQVATLDVDAVGTQDLHSILLNRHIATPICSWAWKFTLIGNMLLLKDNKLNDCPNPVLDPRND